MVKTNVKGHYRETKYGRVYIKSHERSTKGRSGRVASRGPEHPDDRLKRTVKDYMAKEFDLEIDSIRKTNIYEANVPVWEIKSNGQEYLVALSEDDATELAKEELKQMFDDQGIDAFANWVIMDNLDEKAMLETFDEIIESDIEEGTFENKRAAKEYYKEVIDPNNSEFSTYFPKNTIKDYVNEDKLYEDIISADGIGHTLGRYDGNIYELPHDIQLWRVN